MRPPPLAKKIRAVAHFTSSVPGSREQQQSTVFRLESANNNTIIWVHITWGTQLMLQSGSQNKQTGLVTSLWISRLWNVPTKIHVHCTVVFFMRFAWGTYPRKVVYTGLWYFKLLQMNPFHWKYKQKTKKTNKISKPYKILTDCVRKENNNEAQRKDLGPIEVNLEGQHTPRQNAGYANGHFSSWWSTCNLMHSVQ